MRSLFITVALVLTVDQLTKQIVASTMELGQSIAVIENFFYITYVRNPGAAFGMLPYRTAFFVAVTVVVSILIVCYYRYLSTDYRLLRLGLALQLGGALGNLVDRVGTSYVIDFFNLTFWPAVFNLADVAIVSGIGIFLVSFWRDVDFEKKPGDPKDFGPGLEAEDAGHEESTGHEESAGYEESDPHVNIARHL